MANPTMILTRSTTDISACTPNLMPFHIDYTGPAAVSAYMRVEKLRMAETQGVTEETTAVPTESMPSDVEMESQAVETSSNEAQQRPDADNESQATLVAPASQTASSFMTPSSSTETVVSATNISAPPLEDADKRFVASFRGRTIHGLTIDLPAGYGGLLLQSEGVEKIAGVEKDKAGSASVKTKPITRGKEKQKERASEAEPTSTSTRRRGRLARSAAPSSKPIEILDDDAVMENVVALKDNSTLPIVDAQIIPEDCSDVRRLVPSAQFSSFTLWQPDRVVDKNRDEYYRSLTEWVSLANEIHQEVSD
ncbi:hypothetical protein HYPSUDRAFT_77222 [Hypholoma sublateritium FD-334 SS-4]|uniref:Uncharacterized protein n=1 Tax=Hypholoma sublateritium (strain FD-334 SS-4) TaxID=945553 RepID=A0A0D2NVH4_HYPSF|nr:hypothetical protein HYPSUDRAFT_77222 [Hypholoma sublateritium FD-334 SS-4]